jgi:hypothetical protein
MSSNVTVTVTLKGGLGNQLFQYAIGRALSVSLNVPLRLDLSWFKEVKATNGNITTIREYALEPYGLKVSTYYSNRQTGIIAQLIEKYAKIVGKYIPGYLALDGIYYERDFKFDSNVKELVPPVWLHGYWQSYKYFDAIAELLRHDLGQPQGLSLPTQAFISRIKSTDSIALHIRRGDYVSNKNASVVHGLCSIEYYKKGLEIVSVGLHKPHCFIFSDEPEWAKNNLRFSIPTTVVDINGPKDAHEDLWLMSACDRFVIANSSLSWWAAWLSNAANKLVVAPREWFADANVDTTSLIPPEWMRL